MGNHMAITFPIANAIILRESTHIITVPVAMGFNYKEYAITEIVALLPIG